MKKCFKLNFISCALLLACLLTFNSCSKEEVVEGRLIQPTLKSLTLSTGFTDNIFPIKADKWTVSYVKDAVSGELLKDAVGNIVKLDGNSETEVGDGWLKMEKTANNELKISLLENFSATPRNFTVGIQSGNQQDEINFRQMRGEDYELVKKEIKEVEGSRKIYVSSEGCSSMTLGNDTGSEKNVEVLSIFKDVKYRSEFLSESYGAFDWISSQDTMIFMDEILIDGTSYWQRTVPYTKGITTESYIKPGNSLKLLVKPFSSVSVRGEFTYLERTCTYVFTVKNKNSGHLFNVKGTWKQKVPLTPHTIVE